MGKESGRGVKGERTEREKRAKGEGKESEKREWKKRESTSFEMGLSCPLSCGKAVWQPGSTYKVDISQSDPPRTQTADPHRLKMSRLTAIWPSSAYITRIRGSTCLEVAVRAVGCGQRISGMQEIASRGHCLPRVNWGWV